MSVYWALNATIIVNIFIKLCHRLISVARKLCVQSSYNSLVLMCQYGFVLDEIIINSIWNKKFIPIWMCTIVHSLNRDIIIKIVIKCSFQLWRTSWSRNRERKSKEQKKKLLWTEEIYTNTNAWCSEHLSIQSRKEFMPTVYNGRKWIWMNDWLLLLNAECWMPLLPPLMPCIFMNLNNFH